VSLRIMLLAPDRGAARDDGERRCALPTIIQNPEPELIYHQNTMPIPTILSRVPLRNLIQVARLRVLQRRVVELVQGFPHVEVRPNREVESDQLLLYTAGQRGDLPGRETRGLNFAEGIPDVLGDVGNVIARDAVFPVQIRHLSVMKNCVSDTCLLQGKYPAGTARPRCLQ
jgi:hypothetical protein